MLPAFGNHELRARATIRRADGTVEVVAVDAELIPTTEESDDADRLD